ncbi:MAG: aspartate kinase [Dehalococcoidia bacterium]|nr:aspartate kinase [Dehalococcoidia bacterium]
MTLLVHKYGGSSVADAQRILNVARRIAGVRDTGAQVVAVVSAMGDTTDDLIKLAHSVAAEPEPRELDLLLSTGELVSCTLLAMALRGLGYDAISLSGFQAGIRTDTTYGKARIFQVDPARVQKELREGRTVVVAGFQGMTEDMDITTLGRGGSDTTAVALAAALKADRCEVYTDVEGIYTADPRVVPEARKIPEIDYDEMLELASYGAKMHPRAIELGAYYQVPIYVASSFSDAPGTLIYHGPHGPRGPGESAMENRIKVTGIAYQTNVAKITVRSVPDRPGVAAALFEPLAAAGVNVDTIVQNTGVERTTDISFTVNRTELARAVREVQALLKKLGGTEVVTDPGLASVSIVGSGMQNSPGYASRMFRILADGNINIDMITTSEIRISCIVQESQVKEAVRLLHRGFHLEQGP